MLVDRGYQTTTTEGTGPLQLLPPPTGLAALSARGDGPVFYEILAPEDGIWEIGQGIVTGNQLERVTVLSNSNGTTGLINLPAGEKLVFSVLPASRAVYVDDSGALAADGVTPPPPRTREINTVAGLAGGGDLSTDRTLALDFAGVTARTATASGDEVVVVTPSGDHFRVPVTAVIAGLALASRSITGSGLASGGGDLSANRIINVPAATSAQAIAGTSTTVAMTPAATAAVLSDSGRPGKSWTSPDITLTNGGDDSFSHGLGSIPRLITLQLVCIADAHGYSVGDVINLTGSHLDLGSGETTGIAVSCSTTSLRVIQCNAGPLIVIVSGSGNYGNISKSSFRLRVHAWA
ncbi:hypothetical protein P7L70_02190 (plasmid) [Tistrella mobilis]|uniref:hypothetical protein n=1 Tax=Tistrella mobilis TaxID=171437 RepID=UPI0035586D97